MSSDEERLMLAELVAGVRALREHMGVETLLSYAKAAKRFDLKVTQFKARYIATRRLLVVKDGGQPRVLLSEVNQVLDDLKKQALREAGKPPPTAQPATRTRRPTHPLGARDEVAKFKESLKKMRD